MSDLLDDFLKKIGVKGENYPAPTPTDSFRAPLNSPGAERLLGIEVQPPSSLQPGFEHPNDDIYNVGVGPYPKRVYRQPPKKKPYLAGK